MSYLYSTAVEGWVRTCGKSWFTISLPGRRPSPVRLCQMLLSSSCALGKASRHLEWSLRLPSLALPAPSSPPHPYCFFLRNLSGRLVNNPTSVLRRHPSVSCPPSCLLALFAKKRCYCDDFPFNRRENGGQPTDQSCLEWHEAKAGTRARYGLNPQKQSPFQGFEPPRTNRKSTPPLCVTTRDRDHFFALSLSPLTRTTTTPSCLAFTTACGCLTPP